MPLIDVASGLAGPLPWVGAPLALRIAVLLGSLGTGIVAVVAVRRARGER